MLAVRIQCVCVCVCLLALDELLGVIYLPLEHIPQTLKNRWAQHYTPIVALPLFTFPSCPWFCFMFGLPASNLLASSSTLSSPHHWIPQQYHSRGHRPIFPGQVGLLLQTASGVQATSGNHPCASLCPGISNSSSTFKTTDSSGLRTSRDSACSNLICPSPP